MTRAGDLSREVLLGDAPKPAAGWTAKRMGGGSGTISHPWIVTDPACPEGRHPTRHCGCTVFRREADARSYADERNAADV